MKLIISITDKPDDGRMVTVNIGSPGLDKSVSVYIHDSAFPNETNAQERARLSARAKVILQDYIANWPS